MNTVQQYPIYIWNAELHIIVNSLTSDFDNQEDFTINLIVETKVANSRVSGIKISRENGERILDAIDQVRNKNEN